MRLIRPLAFATALAVSNPAAAQEPAEMETAAAEAPPPLDDESSTGGPYVAWGVTVAVGASALVFGMLALSANSSLEEKKAEVTSPDELSSTRDRMIGFAVATDVMLLGTLVAGGVATYLTVEAATGGDEGDAAHLRVGLTPVGIGVQGSF